MGVRRISIRYVNRIVIPEPVVRIEEYLHCAGPSVEGLPDHVNSYMKPNRLSVRRWYSSRPDPGYHLASIRQNRIRSTSMCSGRPMMSSREPKREREPTRYARIERDAFETVITDTARELFDAD